MTGTFEWSAHTNIVLSPLLHSSQSAVPHITHTPSASVPAWRAQGIEVCRCPHAIQLSESAATCSPQCGHSITSVDIVGSSLQLLCDLVLPAHDVLLRLDL